MADHAQGKVCNQCGSLVACAGSYGDKELVGRCHICNKSISIPNEKYDRSLAKAEELKPVRLQLADQSWVEVTGTDFAISPSADPAAEKVPDDSSTANNVTNDAAPASTAENLQPGEAEEDVDDGA